MNTSISQAAILACAALMAQPTLVEACACCDGEVARDVVGWSRSGQSALVRSRSDGCEDTLVFEIFRAGRDEAAGCFDAYSETPTRRIPCENFTQGYDRFGFDDGTNERPTTTARLRDYPAAATSISSTHLRATITPPDSTRVQRDAEADDETDDERAPETTLRVFLWTGQRWQLIEQRAVTLGRPEHGADLEDLPEEEARVGNVPLPISVRVWPAPSGRRALLEISGHNASPGMGFFPDELTWITLPVEARAIPRTTVTESVLAVATMNSPRADSSAAQAARWINQRGLRAHASGNYAEAMKMFATALLANPALVVARYNLACALVRLGRLEAAWVTLEEIATGSCARCAERLERARVDEDLRPLWPRLPSPPR